MKKTTYILLFVGIIILAIGVIYQLMFSNSQIIEEFTGKYSYDNNSIYIYQIDKNELYFIINTDIYGKSIINNKEASGTINNINYKFTIDKDKLLLESTNSSINGSYKKESIITLEEFYNYKYGEYKLLDSKYNGKYSNENMKLTMYQSNDDEVVVFINKNNEKLILKCTIDLGVFLNSSQGDDNYIISTNDTGILLTKEGSQEFYHENLSFENKITSKDVFDLFVEYQ